MLARTYLCCSIRLPLLSQRGRAKQTLRITYSLYYSLSVAYLNSSLEKSFIMLFSCCWMNTYTCKLYILKTEGMCSWIMHQETLLNLHLVVGHLVTRSWYFLLPSYSESVMIMSKLFVLYYKTIMLQVIPFFYFWKKSKRCFIRQSLVHVCMSMPTQLYYHADEI